MLHSLRLVCLALCLGPLFGVAGCAARSQDVVRLTSAEIEQAEREVDERARETWAETTEFLKLRNRGQDVEDPQGPRAAEFFQLFRKYSGTVAGDKALATAFTLWGNVQAVDEIERALPLVDPDSGVWGDLLPGIRNAYFQSERHSDYVELCATLADRLTHPKSRSEILITLGVEALRAGRRDEARAYLEQVIELDADPYYVDQARSGLWEMQSLDVGDPAPDFTGIDLSDNPFALSSLRGSWVLLSFWTTSCAPCVDDLPKYRAIHERFGGEDFTLVGISLDTNLALLRQFIDHYDVVWPQLAQPDAWNGEIARKYNVRSVPRSYLLDPDGRIAAKDLRGAQLELELETRLDRF